VARTQAELRRPSARQAKRRHTSGASAASGVLYRGEAASGEATRQPYFFGVGGADALGVHVPGRITEPGGDRAEVGESARFPALEVVDPAVGTGMGAVEEPRTAAVSAEIGGAGAADEAVGGSAKAMVEPVGVPVPEPNSGRSLPDDGASTRKALFAMPGGDMSVSA
jgi:hypothetical protein